MHKPKVVFVLSASHSGSSLLNTMLDMHTKIQSLGEFYNIESSCMQKVLSGIKLEHPFCMCGKSDPNEWGPVYKMSTGMAFHNSAWKYFEKPEYLVDSSKKVSWCKKVMKDVDPYYIRLTRHGLDRLSFYKKPDGKITVARIRSWIALEKKINEFVSANKKRSLWVKYEDICDGYGLHEICKFLNLEYDPVMRHPWRVIHHSLRGNVVFNDVMREKQPVPIKSRRSRDVLEKKDIKVFKDNGGEKMNKKLGYE